MVIDTVGVSGVPVVSLSVAGRTVTDPAVTSTRELEGLDDLFQEVRWACRSR